MNHTMAFTPDFYDALTRREPLLWLNDALGAPLPADAPTPAAIALAEARLARCAPLLAELFPELIASEGVIESQLDEVGALAQVMPESQGRWFLKRDDSLPVAGSVKARGGFHEVLSVAEALALEHGVIRPDDDRRGLAGPEARALFAQHLIAVGSTGNLGLAIGTLAAALGFRSEVHMSSDAKAWKKERLRARGVQVVEHAGDYAAAVEAGRVRAQATPRAYFVDDEHSLPLFLGYAAAAGHLIQQLAAAECRIDREHPLFVYLPCGVGGAPGGIAHGLKARLGEHVHCFFAEPVAAPCMLVQLASGSSDPISVHAIGLDNRTEADGLAVATASTLVAPLMRGQLSGVFTVDDATLFRDLLAVKRTLGIDLEPSAAAALRGPVWLSASAQGRVYAARHGLSMARATHVIWTTGGALVPMQEHLNFQARARAEARLHPD